MKSIKFRNALLCDYVAKGFGNKHTLVNTFSGDLLVPSYPATIHAGFYVEIIPQPGQPQLLEFEIWVGKEKIGVVETDFRNEPRIGRSTVFAVPILMLAVEEDTRLRLIAACEGFKRTTVIDKTITKREVSLPSASEQPSVQSPSDAPASAKPRAPRRRASRVRKPKK